MNSVPFTGIVVAFNDDRHLGECLSALSFCDEIVVIDLGSQDQSRQTAARFGARVVQHEWVPVVELVRAFATEQARTDWLVFMDPDLIFPSGALGEIRQMIEEVSDLGMVRVPYRNHFLGIPLHYGRWGGLGWYPAILNRDRVTLSEEVHRGIGLKPGYKSLSVTNSEHTIITHYWADTLDQFLAKQRRYYPMEAQILQQSGKRFRWNVALFQSLTGILESLCIQRGYKDGRIGIFLSIFWGWYRLNVALALRRLQSDISLDDYLGASLTCTIGDDRVMRRVFRFLTRAYRGFAILPDGFARDLKGDREIEWTFVAARLGRHVAPHAAVLDFGCGIGTLSLAAASLGVRVLAIDLMAQQFDLVYPNIEFQQIDVTLLDELHETFDLIVNCSTIEHVGLSGRYNSIEAPNGDLDAMRKLHRLLKAGGVMLLTLPIGKDGVFQPLHRTYGPQRLPSLLEGYEVVERQFFRKDSRNIWMPCEMEEAMSETGSHHYYALGCMVLRKS